MLKELRFFWGVLALVIFLGFADTSHLSASPLNKPSLTEKKHAKHTGQLAEDLPDDLFQAGSDFQQRLKFFSDFIADVEEPRLLGQQRYAAFQTPQISHTYRLVYFRFILYPFHAFW